MAAHSTYRLRIDVITREREKRGWDAATLARKAILDPKTLTNVLNGRRVSMKTVSKLGGALHMECDALLAGRKTNASTPKAQGTLLCEITFKFYGDPTTFRKKHLRPFVAHVDQFISEEEDFDIQSVRRGNSVFVNATASPRAAHTIAELFLTRVLQKKGLKAMTLRGDIDISSAIWRARRLNRVFRPTGTRIMSHKRWLEYMLQIRTRKGSPECSEPGQQALVYHRDGTILEVTCTAPQTWEFTERRSRSSKPSTRKTVGV